MVEAPFFRFIQGKVLLPCNFLKKYDWNTFCHCPMVSLVPNQTSLILRAICVETGIYTQVAHWVLPGRSPSVWPADMPTWLNRGGILGLTHVVLFLEIGGRLSLPSWPKSIYLFKCKDEKEDAVPLNKVYYAFFFLKVRLAVSSGHLKVPLEIYRFLPNEKCSVKIAYTHLGFCYLNFGLLFPGWELI